MTSFVHTHLWTAADFYLSVERLLELAALGEKTLRHKEIRTVRTRGATTYFVRSGKRQIFITVDDVKIADKEDGKRVPLTVGIDDPVLRDEKATLLTVGLLLGADVEYAGEIQPAENLFEELRWYDPDKDVVPALELAPGESPF